METYSIIDVVVYKSKFFRWAFVENIEKNELIFTLTIIFNIIQSLEIYKLDVLEIMCDTLLANKLDSVIRAHKSKARTKATSPRVGRKHREEGEEQ